MALKYLTDINLNKNELQNAVIQILATDPNLTTKSANSAGDSGLIWFNSTDGFLKYFNGTNIVPLYEININDIKAGIGNATTASSGLMSSADKATLDGIVSTGGEPNQNAFSYVKVGSSTVAADSKTDTLELVAGSNITLTPDTSNDKVTIAATASTFSKKIDGVTFDGSVDIIHYGVFETTDNNTAISVVCNNFNLTEGARIIVRFKNTFLLPDSHFTLNVNNTGAKEVYLGNTPLTSSLFLGFKPGEVYEFIYNGTNWILLSGAPYTIGSSATLTYGTNENYAVWSAKVLHDYISTTIGAVDAMRFKGTVGTGGDVTTLPTTNVQTGDTYRVVNASTYANQVCEIGDLIIATSTTPTWTVAQTNIDGAITSITGTSPVSVTGSGASRTISVSNATTSSAGLMSTQDKITLDRVAKFSVFEENNPILTPENGICTWLLDFYSIGSVYSMIEIIDNSNDHKVMADIDYQDDTCALVNIVSPSTIAANTYKARAFLYTYV